MKKSGYIKAISLLIVFLTLIIAYVFELYYLNLTIDISLLLLVALVIGIFLGLYLGYYFTKSEHELFEKTKLYVICVVTAVVFMPLLISFMNRKLDFKKRLKVPILLFEQKAKGDVPFGYVKGEQVKVQYYDTAILFNGQRFQCRTKHKPFPNALPGDELEVDIAQGLLGIRYFTFED